jgi:hypothetical protein
MEEGGANEQGANGGRSEARNQSLGDWTRRASPTWAGISIRWETDICTNNGDRAIYLVGSADFSNLRTGIRFHGGGLKIRHSVNINSWTHRITLPSSGYKT